MAVGSRWVSTVSLMLFMVVATLFARFRVDRIVGLQTAASRVREPMRPYHMVRKHVWEMILINVVDALDNANIPFFLSDGTALGVLREGYFPPSDHDMDIGIFYEGPAQVLRVVQALNNTIRYVGTQPLAEKYGTHLRWEFASFAYNKKWQRVHDPCALLLLRGPSDVQFDIFFWFPLPEAAPMDLDRFYGGRVANTGSYYCTHVNVNQPVYYVQKRPFKLKHVKFLGRTMRTADETYLEEVYGPRWRTPAGYHHMDGVQAGNFVSAKFRINSTKNTQEDIRDMEARVKRGEKGHLNLRIADGKIV